MSADIVIIGGGASGLAASVELARRGRKVVILEKQSRVGRKLLSTGNGRCNLTNVDMTPAHYYGARDFAGRVIGKWTTRRIRSFFDGIGIPTVEEEGRIYPRSRQAASVLDALRLGAEEMGVRIKTDSGVYYIKKTGVLFEMGIRDGEKLQAKRVLVCTGGLAAPALGACGDGYDLMRKIGHSITPCFSAIAPLKTQTDRVRPLKGQRMVCSIALLSAGRDVRSEYGEVLFQEAGISGIAAMQLARHAHELTRPKKHPEISLRAMPGPEALQLLHRRKAALPERTMEYFLNGIVSRRIGLEMVKSARLQPGLKAGDLEEGQICALADVLSDWRFPLTGVYGFEQAQVTAGGVRLEEFDPDTLESRRVSGLYAAGELLDVDGDCGGYNLHWAWASALTAAEAIDRSLG